MAKPVTQFICSACGAVHKKWSGRCDACGDWNTITEEAPLSAGPGKTSLGAMKGKRIGLTDLRTQETPPPRRTSGMAELDRVLGGGLVPASATLVGSSLAGGDAEPPLQLIASPHSAPTPTRVARCMSRDATRIKAAASSRAGSPMRSPVGSSPR